MVLIHFKRIGYLECDKVVYYVYFIDKCIGNAILSENRKNIDIILEKRENVKRTIRYCKYILGYFNLMLEHPDIKFNKINKYRYGWFSLTFEDGIEEYQLKL